MKSIDLVDKQKQRCLKTSWLDAVARTLVLRTLAKISAGHLTIEEHGQVYSFGQGREKADIVAHIFVHHPCAYRYVLFNGTVGSGEAYMLKAWSSSDLLSVIRLMVRNMETIVQLDTRWSKLGQWMGRWGHKLRMNSRKGAKKNIAAHYDLGNDFFSQFLDPSMMYSSAIFPSPDASLEHASNYKLRHICERLDLGPSDHLLEIGTGWGGLAVYAAKHFGCRVTTVTISAEQHAHAIEWVRREGLQASVDVQLKDYRDIRGQFDKVVSIEMIEAVGHQYYGEYFRRCSQLLAADGKMLIQAITIADQRYEIEKHNADFIQAYIFPGGCLPSIEVIAKHVSRDTDMQIVGLEDITTHYARTLSLWKSRFFARLDQIKALGFDETFIRMWDFYLNYCEGGFRERAISTSQIVLAKPRCFVLPPVGEQLST